MARTTNKQKHREYELEFKQYFRSYLKEIMEDILRSYHHNEFVMYGGIEEFKAALGVRDRRSVREKERCKVRRRENYTENIEPIDYILHSIHKSELDSSLGCKYDINKVKISLDDFHLEWLRDFLSDEREDLLFNLSLPPSGLFLHEKDRRTYAKCEVALIDCLLEMIDREDPMGSV
jgi:hypothetical protein